MNDGGGSGEFGQLGTLDSFSNGHFYTAKSEVLQLGTRRASYSLGIGGDTLTLSSTEGLGVVVDHHAWELPLRCRS